MGGIALLLPKKELTELACQKVEEEGLFVKEIKYITTSNAVNEARRAVAEGASIIIARGYQALLIKKYTNVPVVEMTMTGQDLGILVKRALALVKKPFPVIGLVGLNNMFANVDYFEEIFDIHLNKYFGISADDLQAAADRAVLEGVDIIIGGDTAIMAAEQAGIPHLFMEPTFDSIREAIKTGETALYAAEVEKRHAAQMGTILDNSFSGIIRINALGIISNVNRIMEEVLEQKEKDLIGNLLSEIFTDIDKDGVEAVLCGKNEMYSSFIRVNGNPIVFILTAVKVDDLIDGAILSCQLVKKRENLATDTMKEMYLHGYVAKSTFSSLKTKDKKMRDCIELAKLFSLSKSPVLLTGKTGSEWKEIAESIHNNSLRRNFPFVLVNCSGLTEEKQDAILFGDADADKKGKEKLGAFSTANRGTLVIEEIEKLCANVQYKIFCAINNYALVNCGTKHAMALDTHIIATTCADLYEKVQSGEFREDLYYVLSGHNLKIPLLRERQADMDKLISEKFKELLTHYSRYHVMSSGAKELLLNYPWAGNKIQMESFLDRMVLSAKKRMIDEAYVSQLLEELYPASGLQNTEESNRIHRDPKAEELAEVLEQCHGDRTMAAERLGISKTTLWRRIKKYGVVGTYHIK